MGIPGGNIHHREVFAADLVGDHRGIAHLAVADHAFALQDDEFFVLGLVPVVALGDVRLGHVQADLSPAAHVQKLRKGAALVGVGDGRPGEILRRQEAEIGGVEFFHQRVALIGGGQAVPQGGEGLDQLGHAAQIHLMDGLDGAPFAFPMGLPFHRAKEFLRHVVDIDQPQRHGRVVDRDGQAPGHVMAEGGHGAVVVGPAPFAEDVGQTVAIHRRACFLGVFRHGLLRVSLALAVGVFQRRLNGRAEQHRRALAVFLQQFQQMLGKIRVALLKICRVRRPVHPRQMKHEIRFRRSGAQLFLRMGHVHQQQPVLVPITARQGGAQVFAHKAPGSRHQNIQRESLLIACRMAYVDFPSPYCIPSD